MAFLKFCECSGGRWVSRSAQGEERQSPIASHLRAATLPVIELVQADLPAQRIPMNSKKSSGSRLIAAGAVQHPLNEFLFEFGDCFIEVDSALHHLAD